jgi:hypothetical protein
VKKLLPTHYFPLTITLPQGLRDVVRSDQKQSYGALFSCTNYALKKLAQDTRFIGSDRIGYPTALHTWGGMLQQTGSIRAYKTLKDFFQSKIQGCNEKSRAVR